MIMQSPRAIIFLCFILILQGVSSQIVFPKDDDDRVDPSKNEGEDLEKIGRKCTTPREEAGKCLRIDECKSLKDETDFDHLRKSICGFSENIPMLCCPQSRERIPPSRPQPTTARPPIVITSKPIRRTRPTRPTRPTRFSTPSITTEPQFGSRNPNSNQPSSESKDLRMPSGLPQDCGNSNADDQRVIGGHPAKPGAWPWMAAIMLRGEGINSAQCGATLITNQVALTAAHCVVTDGTVKEPSTYKVRLGEHNIKEDTPDDATVDYDIESIIVHPDYNVPGAFSNDIAILKLKPRVQFNERISPACLPYDSELFRYKDVTGRQATITGWGQTSFEGQSSDVLLQTSFRIVPKKFCQTAFMRWVNITDLYICAGNEDSSKDSCKGDSGGPMVMLEPKNKRWYLMGIVSFGRNCATPGFPGVYTRVSKLLNWIENNI
ncbi:proclotting enzyme-like [Brevipalpus obovatus]|uniref:proclotting enzyme-like n=1 Tax=Brevipalpus obovatus TaxID=246614 RepID=UPI003D9F8AD3